jgi:hypothetical protein
MKKTLFIINGEYKLGWVASYNFRQFCDYWDRRLRVPKPIVLPLEVSDDVYFYGPTSYERGN